MMAMRHQNLNQEAAEREEQHAEALQRKDADAARLQAAIDELSRNLEQARQDLLNKEGEAAETQSKLTVAEDDLSQARAREMETAARNRELLNRIGAIENEQTATLVAEAANATARANAEESERLRVQGELYAARAELDIALANDRAAQTELARLKADHDDAITMLSANRDRQLAEAHQRAAAAEQARDDAVQRMRVLEAANGASGVCAFHLCWDTHWSALDFLYQLINVRPPARVRARPKKKQGLLRRPWRKRS